ARQYQHDIALRTVPAGTRVYVAYFSSLLTCVDQVDSPKLRPETTFWSDMHTNVRESTATSPRNGSHGPKVNPFQRCGATSTAATQVTFDPKTSVAPHSRQPPCSSILYFQKLRV